MQLRLQLLGKEIQMKKLMLAFMLLTVLAAGMAFAGGNSEEYTRKEYDKRGFVDRSDWLYEFNSMANNVVEHSNDILKEFMVSASKTLFDDSCVKYKVLLDIGVERGFIDDKTRKQQMDKLVVERDKVSKYLAQQSSGLGL
jgi:hypothetical protein